MACVLTYPAVGQCIAEALCAEERGDGPSLCYRRYLSSLRDIFTLLEQEVSDYENQWPLEGALTIRHIKFLGLAQRCLERALDQLRTPKPAFPAATSQGFASLPATPPRNNSPTPVRQPTRRVSSVTEGPKPIDSMRMTIGLESPMETAARQNKALIAAFQRRIQSGRFTSTQLGQLNLSLQRNIAENMGIARSKEESFGRRIEAQLSDQQISLENNRLQHPELFNDPNLFLLYKSFSQFEFHFLSQDTWYQRCKSSRRDPMVLCLAYILRLSQHPIHDTLEALIDRYVQQFSALPTLALNLDSSAFTALGQSFMTELDKISKVLSLLITGDAFSDVLRDTLLQRVLPGKLYAVIIDHLTLALKDPLSYLQEQMDLPLEKQIEQVGLKLKHAFLNDPSAYEGPVQELDSITTPTLPTQKLSALNVAVTSLVHYVRDRMPEEDKGVGADELLPILCYVLLRSRQPLLLLHCKLLEGLVFDDQLDGAEGYTLTTFITAATFCATRPSENDRT